MKKGKSAADDKSRRELSNSGKSWLRDEDFDAWWAQHGDKFPDVPEDRARLIWTAAYDDGYEWGCEVSINYDD